MRSVQSNSLLHGVSSCFACDASRPLSKENAVNTDHITGSADDLAGNDQEEAGEFAGSRAQDTKGIRKQAIGRAEERYGDAKTIAEDAKDAIRYGAHQR
jgi:uncharacterized protein YjbJ (UPF0337 family)